MANKTMKELSRLNDKFQLLLNYLRHRDDWSNSFDELFAELMREYYRLKEQVK